MRPRTEFHDILVALLGSSNVYFQPPTGFKMTYPCIVYNRNNFRMTSADNQPYMEHIRYSVTVIDSNPDSEVVLKMARQPMTSFERHFASEGLNHDVFVSHY